MRKVLSTLMLTTGLVPPASAQTFQHIIVVIQENRTPDSLFQGLCTPTQSNPTPCSTQPSPGQYNIQTTAWFDKTSPTLTTDPTSVPLGVNYDIGHSHAAFLSMCDKQNNTCKMDGAATEPCVISYNLWLGKLHVLDQSRSKLSSSSAFYSQQRRRQSTMDDAKGIFVVNNTPVVGRTAPSNARVRTYCSKRCNIRSNIPLLRASDTHRYARHVKCVVALLRRHYRYLA